MAVLSQTSGRSETTFQTFLGQPTTRSASCIMLDSNPPGSAEFLRTLSRHRSASTPARDGWLQGVLAQSIRIRFTIAMGAWRCREPRDSRVWANR